jgi:hypothetical protein
VDKIVTVEETESDDQIECKHRFVYFSETNHCSSIIKFLLKNAKLI